MWRMSLRLRLNAIWKAMPSLYHPPTEKASTTKTTESKTGDDLEVTKKENGIRWMQHGGGDNVCGDGFATIRRREKPTNGKHYRNEDAPKPMQRWLITCSPRIHGHANTHSHIFVATERLKNYEQTILTLFFLCLAL